MWTNINDMAPPFNRYSTGALERWLETRGFAVNVKDTFDELVEAAEQQYELEHIEF